MLRAWQTQCIKLAKEKYKSGKNHFLAQATPGAGKTIMAATLAKQLIEEDLIDFVICFGPSISVVKGIKNTFSRTLDCNFEGRLAEKGCAMTYQSLRFVDRTFWNRLARYRVLCIFDEIHHCCGNSEEESNSWGLYVIRDVQIAATNTLALTGTPWRSNHTPITLASYTNQDGMVICDYQYSLAQAVEDQVCRKPTIALIDSKNLTLSKGRLKESYNSLAHLVNDSEVNYLTILNDKNALSHILTVAVEKLKYIRCETPNSAGLIVAASINHAKWIAQCLKSEFNQSVVLVTHKSRHAHSKIQAFRNSTDEWVVSVGMVSEGTDIPRLQVCCYLTNVNTELYFRQVLGRIIRITKGINQESWFYTFATSKMTEFAEGIEADIPNSCLYLDLFKKSIDCIDGVPSPFLTEEKDEVPKSKHGPYLTWKAKTYIDQYNQTEQTNDYFHLSLADFNQRVIEAFRGT